MFKEKLMGLGTSATRSNTAEKLAAKTTRDHPDDSDWNDYSESLKVDLCFYPADGVAKRDYIKGHCSVRTRWAWISLLAEVKTTHEQLKKSDDKMDSEPTTSGSELAGTTSSKVKQGEPKAPVDGAKLPQEATTSSGSAKKVGNACSQESEASVPTTQAQEKPQLQPFIRSGLEAEASLGQMVKYVAKIFRRQHRTHLFMRFIFQGQVRVIRWDRAGAIVSTVIDFEQQPSLFHEIIWRYAHMSQAQRGFDTTAVLASKEEVDSMRACEAPDEWTTQQRHSALDQPGWPVYKLTKPHSDLVDQSYLGPITMEHTPMPRRTRRSVSSAEVACFIVGRQYFTADSPTGHGTKCYIAYDISHDRLVSLKDFWRPDVMSAPPEGMVLRELRSAGVENILTPLAAGDVRNSDLGAKQKTCTQTLLGDDESIRCRPAALIHYRLVMQEICRPLEDHDSPQTLTKAMLDAFLAHQQAYTLKGYSHCDLSDNNILLWYYTDVDGRVQLMYLETVLRPGRSGTWQIMSARLLYNPGNKHELADDFEAFVHFSAHVVNVFESSDLIDGERIGGAVKYPAMLRGVKMPLFSSHLRHPNTMAFQIQPVCSNVLNTGSYILHFLGNPSLPRLPTCHAGWHRAPEEPVFHTPVNVKSSSRDPHTCKLVCKAGILNDWDICKTIQCLDIVSPHAHFGTWQFMSARLLRNPSKKHELADDLEAFVHILSWETLRFYEHTSTGHHNQLFLLLRSFFGECNVVWTDDAVGGHFKHDAMIGGFNIVTLKASKSLLARLLQELTEICREHYEATEPEKQPITGKSEVKPFGASLTIKLKAIINQHSQSKQTQSVVSAAALKQAKLSSHGAFIFAFASAMLADTEERIPLVKTEDQIAHY
ncbi:hypothetical protein C8Q72DRAFT_937017 [Fomitopsis betulina]|nr:hypothetical protein C8Q72DRAFT_937017 [Fomitopsis betulina]